MDKASALHELALKRKSDRLPRHKCFRDFHGGMYDEHCYVVPWTISAHNPDAEVMIMGQDWNSEENLSKKPDADQARLGQIEWLPTNKNLKSCLKGYLDLEFGDTYATDLFAFVKPGGMSGGIPDADLMYSAHTYALPQITIVRPLVVICLGMKTYNGLRRALGHTGYLSTNQAQEENLTYERADIFAVTHTGGQAFWKAKKAGLIEDQWRRIAQRLAERRSERRSAAE